MRLQGRNLRRDQIGPDVAELQSDLALIGHPVGSEADTQRFGESTERAVIHFQRKNGLQPDGVVGPLTAKLLNGAIDALPDHALTVSGEVRHQDGTVLEGVVVRCYDRTPQQDVLIADTFTNERGGYRLSVTRQRDRAAGLHGPNLTVKVFGQAGVEIGQGPVVYGARHDVVLDVTIVPPSGIPESQFERLNLVLFESLDGRPLFRLQPHELARIAGETGIPEPQIVALADAATLARTLKMSTEIAYAFQQQGLATVDAVLGLTEAQLNVALERAVSDGHVSRHVLTASARALRRIARERRRRAVEQTPVRTTEYRAIGRLVTEDTGAPLPGVIVEIFTVDPDRGPEQLGAPRTGRDGHFPILYSLPERATGEPPVPRTRVRLVVRDRRKQILHTSEIEIDPDRVFELRVPPPASTAPPSPPLREIAAVAGIPLSDAVMTMLESRGIGTLAAIRAAGGIEGLLEVPPSQTIALRALDAQARLDVISPDRAVNATLFEHGFGSPTDIRRMSRRKFVSALGEVLGHFDAARLHVMAKTSASYADSVSAWLYASAASSSLLPDNYASAVSLLPLHCECDDCQSAVSPLAYLADLLRYSMEHVEQNGTPITFGFFASTFHQPFAELPKSCEQMEALIRQVRIAVEVLRGYLQVHPPAAAAAATLAEAERVYRWAAYTTILTQLGTSYEAVRLARSGSTDDREELAERLGLEPADESVQGLFLDAGTPGTEAFLNAAPEEELEQRFGFRTTTGPPALTGTVTSQLQTWKLAFLRSTWRAADWPDDAIGPGRPVIDPDVIGPDDFRSPVDVPDSPFRVWVERRIWIDELLQSFQEQRSALTGADDLDVVDTLLEQMYLPLIHPGLSDTSPWDPSTPVSEFEALRLGLSTGTQVEAITAQIRATLRLSADAFIRLATVRHRAVLSSSAMNHPPVEEGEWADLLDILVQAAKEAVYALWRSDEAAAGITVDGRDFWLSLAEPIEGPLPPGDLDPEQPLVDPEILKLPDLAEPTAGAQAHALWHQRADQLDARQAELTTIRLTMGFEPMLEAALVGPNDNALPSPAARIELLALATSTADPAGAAAAAAQIDAQFFMSVEQFQQVVAVQVKSADPIVQHQPSDQEWTGAEAILTTAWKRKSLFSVWIAEEQAAGIDVAHYWTALKLKRPAWRATAEDRRLWRRALEIRTQPPNIDPDLLNDDDFKNPVPVDPAFGVFATRQTSLSAQAATLAALPQNLEGFDGMVAQVLGLPSSGLDELNTQSTNGADIGLRLGQLNLDYARFSFLIRMRALLVNHGLEDGELLPSEWQEVYAVLIQVEKERSYARWRDEEKSANLTLSQDHFVLPQPDTASPVLPQPFEPVKWRGTPQARVEWQARLQARLDQEKAVLKSIDHILDATEEAVLPDLRDALIRATNAKGQSLAQRAKWLEDRLLLDLRVSGCQTLTRVSHAITTIQTLLWSLRTGQIADTLPALSLEADDFDDEWPWIGQYGSWRSAMFTYLYPENLLIPTLKTAQTPIMQQLAADLRLNRQFTPQAACQAAETYQHYFEDVCGLQLQASCCTRTRLHSGACGDVTTEHCLLYMFGRGVTGAIYWSSYDPYEPSDTAQTFWHRIDSLGTTARVIGAVPSNVPDDQHFIFLFVVIVDKGEKKLAFTRYDLETQQWDGSLEFLDVPHDATDFDAVAYQRDVETRSPLIAVRLRNGPMKHGIFWRRLNPQHTDWADADWKEVVGPSRGFSISALLAVVQLRPDFLAVLVREDDGRITYQTVGESQDGRFYDVDASSTDGSVGSSFCGTVHWPNSDLTFVLWKQKGTAYYSRLSGDSETYEIADLLDYDEWLGQSTGISLAFAATSVPGKQIEFYTGVPMNSTSPEHLKSFFPSDWTIAVDNPEAFYRMTLTLPAAVSLLEHVQALADLYAGMKDVNNLLDPAAATAWWTGYAEDVIAEISALLAQACELLDDLMDSGSNAAEWQFVNQLSKDVCGKSICAMLKTFTFAEQTFVLQRPVPQARHVWPYEDLVRVAPSWPIWYEPGKAGQSDSACDLSIEAASGCWRMSATASPNGIEEVSAPVRTTPDALTWPHVLTPQKSIAKQLALWAWDRVADGPRSNLTYLEEAWYLLPMLIAMQCQRAGQFVAALDWYRAVYDYGLPEKDRKQSAMLIYDTPTASLTFTRPDNWLQDPLNPHAIADTRPGTYTRFTIQTIADCMIDYAHADFTADTAESVPRARILYQTAIDLLESKGLKAGLGFCEEVIGSIEIAMPKHLQRRFDSLKASMRGIAPQQLQLVTDQVTQALTGTADRRDGLTKAKAIVDSALAAHVTVTLAEALSATRDIASKVHTSVLAVAEHDRAVRRLSETEGHRFRHSVSLVTGIPEATLIAERPPLAFLAEKSTTGVTAFNESALAAALPRGSNAHLRSLHYDPTSVSKLATLASLAKLQPQKGIDAEVQFRPQYQPSINFAFCVPVNPIVSALRRIAELNLFKIHHCRNIAGLERQLDPYAAPTDTLTGLPTIDGEGELVIPAPVRFPPTPYRYRVLIERAKQLVVHAEQLEGALLAALEKADAESYTLLKARQELQLAKAGVRLHHLRVQEAQSSARLAELQHARAVTQVAHFEGLLAEGMTALEEAAIRLLETAAGLQSATAVMNFIASGFQFASAAAAFADPKASVSQGLSSMAGGFTGIGSGLSSLAAAASTNASVLSMYANHERQMQEWEFQRQIAAHDVQIASQGIRVAEHHVRVVGEEHAIAKLQADHSESTVEFLTKKFTNAELYFWMSRVIERIYAYFLQQATATAQTAAMQLAFERQENAPPYIQADYWNAPSEAVGLSAEEGAPADRKGLTGSARLLQDVYQLDQYAFQTDRRKLQLTKTFLLSRLAPVEFQRFRETGVMLFATPMIAFDRDFPGHYLRLIHRVRVTMIALVPPGMGIAATLTAAGTSRVVVGGTIFQNIAVNHGHRSVAFTSPRDATGTFELDPQADLITPFEGMGVDALWELRMPRAANLLDYDSIAEVLVTIEYFALDSFEYRQQIIHTLKDTVQADRPFSFWRELSDAWYDLNNPDQTSTPLIVRFTTTRADFPANLEQLKIAHVLLYFARADGESFEVPVSHFRFEESDGSGPVGGGSTSIDGVIGTRRGNAGSWMPMIGKVPFGTWELALPNTQQMREDIKKTKDILFVLSYTGRTPAWPA